MSHGTSVGLLPAGYISLRLVKWNNLKRNKPLQPNQILEINKGENAN